MFTSSSAEPERDPWPGFDHTNGVWEVGYCIGKAWWNKGFTTEALKAVVEYWFKNTDSSWLACCHALKILPAAGSSRKPALSTTTILSTTNLTAPGCLQVLRIDKRTLRITERFILSELYDILVETPPTKVVLLALDQGLWDCERSLAELAALCEANHMEAVAP